MSKIKNYLVASPNTIKFIEALVNVRYRGSVHAAVCMYASVCDFEYRGISCTFQVDKLKNEIKRFLSSNNIKISFSANYPIFQEFVLSDDLINSIGAITLSKFIELSILNLDYLTRNNYIVHYITTGSVEAELVGTHDEQIAQIVSYWASRIDESMLSVDFSEAHEQCWMCGLKRKLEICHIIPESLGGERIPSNLVLMCKHCHRLAPNVDNPDAMWDYLKGHKITLYKTYWMEEAKREFKIMYKKDFEDEMKKIVDYANKNNISITSYFSKDYMRTFPKVSNHFGEMINASTWAFIEYSLLYRLKRDLKLLPEYKFKVKLESFPSGTYYISIPNDIHNDYGNRTIGVQVNINGVTFITKLDVYPYSSLYIPEDIIERINISSDEIDVSIIEYMDLQDIIIPEELNNLLTPISMRYFMFLSYTDKMKFINYILLSVNDDEKLKRAKYCAGLLEAYKKFQDR